MGFNLNVVEEKSIIDNHIYSHFFHQIQTPLPEPTDFPKISPCPRRSFNRYITLLLDTSPSDCWVFSKTSFVSKGSLDLVTTFSITLVILSLAFGVFDSPYMLHMYSRYISLSVSSPINLQESNSKHLYR